MSKKLIYLSGGFYGTWKKDVVACLGKSYKIADPEKPSFIGPKDIPGCYVGADLQAIDAADVVIAYQDDYPFVYGMAAEVGYAVARGVPVIFVCTAKRVDGFLAGLARAVFTDTIAACEFVRKRYAP